MKEPAPIVYLVDDEPSVLKALGRLLRSAGFEAKAYANPADFLEEHDPRRPGCLVLDLAMPGITGLELQQKLATLGSMLPTIFLTGNGDVHSGVKAMKEGAVDFLTKPVSDDDLLAAINQAIEQNRNLRKLKAARAEIENRLSRLTPREREVLLHIISGKMNREVAVDLGTAEKTIKVHRARIMEKVEVTSVAELVRLTEQAGIAPAR